MASVNQGEQQAYYEALTDIHLTLLVLDGDPERIHHAADKLLCSAILLLGKQAGYGAIAEDIIGAWEAVVKWCS